MKTRIVRIGNSQGIRIPKPALEQSGMGEGAEVDLEVTPGQIVITPATPPRAGWDDAFREMAAHGDDELLDPTTPRSRWDDEEWDW